MIKLIQLLLLFFLESDINLYLHLSDRHCSDLTVCYTMPIQCRSTRLLSTSITNTLHNITKFFDKLLYILNPLILIPRVPLMCIVLLHEYRIYDALWIGLFKLYVRQYEQNNREYVLILQRLLVKYNTTDTKCVRPLM